MAGQRNVKSKHCAQCVWCGAVVVVEIIQFLWIIFFCFAFLTNSDGLPELCYLSATIDKDDVAYSSDHEVDVDSVFDWVRLHSRGLCEHVIANSTAGSSIFKYNSFESYVSRPYSVYVYCLIRQRDSQFIFSHFCISRERILTLRLHGILSCGEAEQFFGWKYTIYCSVTDRDGEHTIYQLWNDDVWYVIEWSLLFTHIFDFHSQSCTAHWNVAIRTSLMSKKFWIKIAIQFGR